VRIFQSHSLDPLHESNLLNQILHSVSKIGRVLAFADAEATCASTGHVISVGRHTKYLPSRSRLQDLALGPLMPVTKIYASLLPSYLHGTTPTMKHLISFQNREETHPVQLHLSRDHYNPMGSFHVSSDIMMSLDVDRILFKGISFLDSLYKTGWMSSGLYGTTMSSCE
jgi:hypothetical protein